MGPNTSNSRKLEILHTIVRAYIETGDPVASRSVARDRKDQLSAASVRNVMADLVDEGYLSQPHTSAGRTPTDRGYRFFVDHFAPIAELPSSQRREVADFFSSACGCA